MEANETDILRLLDGSDKKFIIPVFQRSYSWEEKHCKQLLKDLRDVYERNLASHFFGSIVFNTYNNGTCNEYMIIDGQQRITTVSLLLLAIRDYLHKNSLNLEGIIPDKITNAYLTDQYAQDGKKLKLKLVDGDDAAYEQLSK